MAGDPIEFPNVTDVLYPDTDNILWPGSPAPKPRNFRQGVATANSTSVLNIWNRALLAIGTSTTIAGEQENSTEARACRMLYDPVRDQTLRMARWGFARGMDTLTLLKAAPGTPERTVDATPPTSWNATMPQMPWLYSYAYPSEAVLIQRIPLQATIFNGEVPLTTAPTPTFFSGQNPVASARFTIAQDQDPISGGPIRNILTNVPQALVVFNRQTTDPTVFDALFTQSIVDALAAQLAISLTGDKSLSKMCYDRANACVMQARAMDGNEQISTVDHLPDWVAIRSGGAGARYSGLGQGYLSEPYAALWGGF